MSSVDTSGSVYQDGLFSRIVGIHFPEEPIPSTASFAVGDNDGFISFGGFKAGSESWSVVGSIPEAAPGGGAFIFGAASSNTVQVGKQGQPVLVMGGSVKQEASVNTVPYIMASRNGRSWQQVWVDGEVTDSENDRWQSTLMAMVWNPEEKTFYAEVNQAHQHFISTEDGFKLEYDQGAQILLRSSNGQSWSETQRRIIWYIQYYPTYSVGVDSQTYANTDGLIIPHCSNRAKDGRGTPLPDGLFGYWEQRDSDGHLIFGIKAVPTRPLEVEYINAGIRFTDNLSSVDIVVVEGGKEISYTSDVGFPVSGAACFGNVIAVVGGGQNFPAQTAVSLDRGKTWNHGSTSSNFGVVVIGAPG